MEQKHTGMDPWEALRNAIVIQAAEDYRKSLQALKGNPDNYMNRQTKRECEDFFTSDWFKDLSEVSGVMIMKEIQKEEA